MATSKPHSRTRKLPRNILSWIIAFIAGAAAVMIAYRFGNTPNSLREQRQEEREKKELANQRPGDPVVMKQLLEQAAKKAREDKEKEDREKRNTSPSAPPPGKPPTGSDMPGWTNVPGRMPAGTPSVESYEAAKLMLQKQNQGVPEQAKASMQIAAFESDDAPVKAAIGATGNQQLDAMLAQLGAAPSPAAAAAGPASAENPNAALLQHMAQLQQSSGAPAGQARSNEEWMKRAGEQGDKGPLVARPPLSPYALYQGAWIPCALMWALNSDMPGEAGCMVTEDVYSNSPSRALVISKYSQLFGPYSSDVANGQTRFLIAFRRLRFPSGASVDLGAMTGADRTGRAGVTGEVNSHFWEMFGSSFLIAGLTRLVGRNDQPSGTTVNINLPGGGGVSSLSAAAGQVIVDTAQKVLARNTTIKPTLDQEAGVKLMVLVNRDLILPPDITQTRSK